MGHRWELFTQNWDYGHQCGYRHYMCVLGSLRGGFFSHVPATATDAVGLDPPFWRYYPRVILRTFLRWIGLQENCAPGCPEKLREFYAANGMLRCAWRGHNKYRTRFAHLVDGDSRLKRFGGWWYLKSLQEWLASVAATRNKNAL